MSESRMSSEELIGALRRMAVETGSLNCLGCGHEHGCGVHGCAVLKAAAEMIRAAVSDLEQIGDCVACAYMVPGGVDGMPCMSCKSGECFVWGGRPAGWAWGTGSPWRSGCRNVCSR